MSSKKKEEVEKQLKNRAHQILAKMEYFKDALTDNTPFFLGGSAIAASNPNDIDIFFLSSKFAGDAIRWVGSKTGVLGKIKKIYDGDSAYTFECSSSDVPFQFIRKSFGSLQIMIDSFDFAHIQAGVEVVKTMGKFEICRTYWTDAYEKSLEIGDSWYTGSDNPFSALYRLSKYHAKGEVSALSFKTQMIKIINDMFEQEYIGSAQVRRQLSVIAMSDVFGKENSDLYLHNQDIDRLIGNLIMIAWHKLFK